MNKKDLRVRRLAVLAMYLLIPMSVFPIGLQGGKKPTQPPEVKKKEFNLRYTYQNRTEMVNMPMQMPSEQMTISIKGKRKREDDESRKLATIQQCDLQRTVYINLMNQTCLVQPFRQKEDESDISPQQPQDPEPEPEPEEPTQPEKPRKGGVMVIEGEITDTGERKEMFGLKARHIFSRQVIDAKEDSCNPGHFEMELELWLVDLPRWTCRVKEEATTTYRPPIPTRRPDCRDTIRTNLRGNAKLLEGFELYRKMTMTMEGQPVSMIYEVTELSLAELDPALFEKPPDCREMTDAQAFWKGVRSPGGFSFGDAMKSAVGAAGKDAVGMGVELTKPKPAGTIRIGVSARDSSGASLNIPALRREMVDVIRDHGGDAADAVELVATASADLQAEAQAKQVDYVLSVDLREAKPDTGRKIGGILGRAAGVDVKDKTSAKLNYQWIEAAKMQTLGNRSLSEKLEGTVPEAMEQFCRQSAEQALSELWRIRKKS